MNLGLERFENESILDLEDESRVTERIINEQIENEIARNNSNPLVATLKIQKLKNEGLKMSNIKVKDTELFLPISKID